MTANECSYDVPNQKIDTKDNGQELVCVCLNICGFNSEIYPITRPNHVTSTTLHVFFPESPYFCARVVTSLVDKMTLS